MSLMRRLTQILRKELALALLRTFPARGIAALGSFLLVFVLARTYGAIGVGIFALAQSLVLACAVFGRWGMNNALLRFVGRDLVSPKIVAYLRLALIRALIISVGGALIVFALRHLLASAFHAPELGAVLVWFAIAIPAFVLSFVISGFMAAVRRPATASLLQNGAISLLTTALIVLFGSRGKMDGIVDVGIAYAIGAWVVCVFAFALAYGWSRRHCVIRLRLSKVEVAEFKVSASAFFATDIASFLLSVVAIWIAGYMLVTADVGIYKAAWQVSMLIELILVVINLIFPARFTNLFYRGDLAGLERLARHGAGLGLMLAAPPVTVCLVLPDVVLGFIGPGLSGGALALQILAAAQLVNLGCGSVGHVLNMTGNETLSRNIAWTSNVIGLAGLTVGATFFGIAGVAFGVAVAITLRKVIGVYYVWRKLKIVVLPVPHVVRMLAMLRVMRARW